jgi:choline dehydrogenase
VVLASGAVGTPAPLQHSGIGPAPLPQSLGSAPRHALPGVGENLQDHLQILVVFEVRGVRTLNTRWRARSPARPASGCSTCCGAAVP